jgi:hypothetical protein
MRAVEPRSLTWKAAIRPMRLNRQKNCRAMSISESPVRRSDTYTKLVPDKLIE